jgi:hypothetical protein
MGKPGQVDETPLKEQLFAKPFERWELEFVGPFNPKSNKKAYILVATDYMTKWVEVETLPKHIKKKSFQKGDWALLYDSRFQDFPGKLQTRWLGPYEINEVHDNGTVTLITIDGSRSPFLVNGHRLRLYHQPPSKESFCQEVSKDPTVQILAGWEGNPTASTP